MTTIEKITRLRQIRQLRLNIGKRAVRQSERMVKLGKEAEALRQSIPANDCKLYAQKLVGL